MNEWYTQFLLRVMRNCNKLPFQLVSMCLYFVLQDMESPPSKRTMIRNDISVNVLHDFLEVLTQQDIPNEILGVISTNLHDAEVFTVIGLVCNHLKEFVKFKMENRYVSSSQHWDSVIGMLHEHMTAGTPNVSFVNWYMYSFIDIDRMLIIERHTS